MPQIFLSACIFKMQMDSALKMQSYWCFSPSSAWPQDKVVYYKVIVMGRVCLSLWKIRPKTAAERLWHWIWMCMMKTPNQQLDRGWTRYGNYRNDFYSIWFGVFVLRNCQRRFDLDMTGNNLIWTSTLISAVGQTLTQTQCGHVNFSSTSTFMWSPRILCSNEPTCKHEVSCSLWNLPARTWKNATAIQPSLRFPHKEILFFAST